MNSFKGKNQSLKQGLPAEGWDGGKREDWKARGSYWGGQTILALDCDSSYLNTFIC